MILTSTTLFSPTICLGRFFAVAEFKILIAALVRHFVFEDAGAAYDFYRFGSNTVNAACMSSVHYHVR
ncbi:hypothetical protein DAEQUDRAFT_769961 [Daedalea quercina L-15889]|uniref:Uncharacterized protein n=1 Tax=Daedalea quercina L-15889 TaxID=1314783 RepID=A0A165L9L5_9APHY|nr:hypothetical protein DAEQUDRAFT_769961 [Daedalea quercina L-15889]